MEQIKALRNYLTRNVIIEVLSKYCRYFSGKSDIKIAAKDKEVNAKSIMSVMSLGIDGGDEITLTIDGEDEDKAMEELAKLINEELPEEE